MIGLLHRNSLSPEVRRELDQLVASLNALLKVSLDDQGVLRRGLSIGTIVVTGSTVIPTGWLACSGAAVSRTTYRNLFLAVGTAFGVGDGTTSFNLPTIAGPVAGTTYIILAQ